MAQFYELYGNYIPFDNGDDPSFLYRRALKIVLTKAGHRKWTILSDHIETST